MGKWKDKNGYVKVAVDDHPKAYNGNVHEHVIVMEKYLGRPIPKGAVVHHRNRVRADNRIENLLLLRSEDDHLALHRAINANDAEMVQSWEEWSFEFMEMLKAGQPETACFAGELAVVDDEEVAVDDSEKIVARRNKTTNKLFIEFDEEVLISPEGRDIELDLERFGGAEEVSEQDLTPKQLEIYQNKIKGRESEAIENKKKLALQKALFNELRKARMRMAVAKGVPAYVVFSDKALKEIAEVMPTTESVMQKACGFPPAKIRLFGSYFVNVVRKFKKDFDVS